ncbi:methyltransferase domain-containing protein [Actinomadura syzygii]|uniref:Methyltransferase domain-containing protein n=1 Tax=Actinomadura syzygii TaxID=1427538 RepID=A0A5D0TYF7_9ACTN|nr:methyltransferase domain-containing protein [Actinomadura syzygii]
MCIRRHDDRGQRRRAVAGWCDGGLRFRKGVDVSVTDRASPEVVELWDGERIRGWQDYHLAGVADLISAVNLSQALLALVGSGMLDRLRQDGPCPRDALLDGLNPEVGAGFLRYLSVCGVLEEFGGAYRLTRRGTMLTSDIALARLGFYLEAYGPVTRAMTDLLTGSARYGVDVTRAPAALGRHSGTVSTVSYLPIVRRAMAGRSAARLIDLGCGTGSLLIQLCQADPELTGVGLDIAPEAIAAARETADRAGVGDRARFAVADAFDPATWPDGCDGAEVICGIGVLHEHFRDGDGRVVELLDRYADILTGDRVLLIGEPEVRYDNRENDSDFFLVHVLTAQGIPRDRQGWLAVFGRTRLQCGRLYTSAVAGPRTCFYELTPEKE